MVCAKLCGVLMIDEEQFITWWMSYWWIRSRSQVVGHLVDSELDFVLLFGRSMVAEGAGFSWLGVICSL